MFEVLSINKSKINRRLIACITAVNLFCFLVTGNVFALAPDTGKVPRVHAVGALQRFDEENGLGVVTDPITEKDTPAVLSPFPPIESDTIGRQTPEWVECGLAASAVLELTHSKKREIKVGRLLKLIKKKYDAHGITYTNIKAIDALNRMRNAGLIENSRRSLFVLDRRDTLRIAVSPRAIAIWADTDAVINFIQKDLREAIKEGKICEVLEDYARAVDNAKLYPIESQYPVMRAIVLMNSEEQDKIKNAVVKKYAEAERSALIDAVLMLLDKEKAQEGWMDKHAPSLKGKQIYSVAAEISLLAGGLGRVMQYHGNGLKRLGANVTYIEPMYRRDKKGNPIDYANLPVKVDIEREPIAVLSTYVQGHSIRFALFKGINEQKIPVYFVQDIDTPFGCPIADQLYTYKSYENPNAISNEIFTEFFSKATLEAVRYLEKERMGEEKEKWSAPLVDLNDGQCLPAAAFAKMFYSGEGLDNETRRIFEEMRICGTTHTYRNRVIIYDFEDGLDFLRKAGVPEDKMWVFTRNFGTAEKPNIQWDFTSAGLRSADMVKGVSAVHAYEVGDYDPSIELSGITNGDNIPYSTTVYRECMRGLGIPEERYPNLTGEEIRRVKSKAKEKLIDRMLEKLPREKEDRREMLDKEINELFAKIKALAAEMYAFEKMITDFRSKNDHAGFKWANDELAKKQREFGRLHSLLKEKQEDKNTYLSMTYDTASEIVKQLDPNKMTISYSGRWVNEKAGETVLTKESIMKLVRDGVQVVICGNVQSYFDSRELGRRYIKMMKEIYDEIEKEKQSRPKAAAKYGCFIFLPAFDINDQLTLLAATDIQEQYSTRGTGASEYTEADVSANGGLMLSPPYWEGIIGKQGIPIDWREMKGNTLIPRDDSPEAFAEVVLRAHREYKKPDGKFSELQRQSLQLSRLMDADFTSAAFARFWHRNIKNKTKLASMPLAMPPKPHLWIKDGDNYPEEEKDNDGGRAYYTSGRENVSVNIEINLYGAPVHEKGGGWVPAEMCKARLVDKMGRVIDMKFASAHDGKAYFSCDLSQYPFDGYYEVSYGTCWCRYPISIRNSTENSTLSRIEREVKNSLQYEIAKEGGFVKMMIEFECRDNLHRDQLVPILHTDAFGEMDDIDPDSSRLMSSQVEKRGIKTIWTFTFRPEWKIVHDGKESEREKVEATYYVTMKESPWLKAKRPKPNDRRNIEIYKRDFVPDTPVEAAV